jgi:hypothetical protein
VDSRLIVLGLGPDPRIYTDVRISAVPLAAHEVPAVLTYREKSPEPDVAVFIVEFLLEGGVELVVELLFLGWN